MRSRFTSLVLPGCLALVLSSACSDGSNESRTRVPATGGEPTGGIPAAGGSAATGGNGNVMGSSGGSGNATGAGGLGGGGNGATGGGGEPTIGGTGSHPASGGAGDQPAAGGTGNALPAGGTGNDGTGGAGNAATGASANAGSGGAGNAATGGAGNAPAGGAGNAETGGGGAVTVSGTQYLSDLCDSGSDNGWGPVERDLSNGEDEARDGGPLIVNGELFSKGIGMHAPAEMTFSLGGRCTAFAAEVGVDEEMKDAGSVVFQVWGDGAMLYESATIAGREGPLPIDVDITGVQALRLVADEAGGNGSDHADWGDARVVCEDLVASLCMPEDPGIPVPSGWHLVWSDEFDVDGSPNSDNWGYESGMVRNNEWQYYTDQNATVVGGFLVIQGRRESYQGADYTSSSLKTTNDDWSPKQAFQYGRFEMRARIVAEPGLWPAFWTVGTGLGNWPFNGEIDIMEYYDDRVHANVASSASTDQNAYSAQWDSSDRLVSDFGDDDWDAKFHVWRMDWDSERIVLSIDDYEMNDVPIDSMLNVDGTNPFAQPHVILVNLAIGGNAGGDASATHFPVHYVVDYVRVYQQD